MIAQPHDQAEGERLKTEAHALLEARRQVYVRRGRRALLRKMLDGDGAATADDVRDAVELPAGMEPRCLGTVPGRLAYDRIIRPAGFVRSKRPERHASWIEVWELADSAAAEAWLETNPDLPHPGTNSQGGASQRVLFAIDPTNETDPGVCRRRGRSR